jgi:hypothetical protein
MDNVHKVNNCILPSIETIKLFSKNIPYAANAYRRAD